jgi:hypothetical protein
MRSLCYTGKRTRFLHVPWVSVSSWQLSSLQPSCFSSRMQICICAHYNLNSYRHSVFCRGIIIMIITTQTRCEASGNGRSMIDPRIKPSQGAHFHSHQKFWECVNQEVVHWADKQLTNDLKSIVLTHNTADIFQSPVNQL